MIRLGEKQRLSVLRTKDFGVYVGESEEAVLLPKKYVPEGIRVGDSMEVFVYRDSSDRLIATTETPMLTLGQVGLLRVKEVGKIGAFLDWKRICFFHIKSRQFRCVLEKAIRWLYILTKVNGFVQR